jgi:tetratricopeptide (TPR) repeat protein
MHRFGLLFLAFVASVSATCAQEAKPSDDPQPLPVLPPPMMAPNLPLCLRLPEPTLSLEALTEMIRADRCDARAYKLRGIHWLAEGNCDVAILDFSDSLRLNYYQPEVFVLRGIARLSNKKYDHAADDFDLALRLDPTRACAYYWRATAMVQKWAGQDVAILPGQAQNNFANATAALADAKSKEAATSLALVQGMTALTQANMLKDQVNDKTDPALKKLIEANQVSAVANLGAVTTNDSSAKANSAAAQKNLELAQANQKIAVEAFGKARTELADALRDFDEAIRHLPSEATFFSACRQAAVASLATMPKKAAAK